MSDEQTFAPDQQPEQEEQQWVLMIDPAWQPQEEDEKPPLEAVVGGWHIAEDGTPRSFEPNPEYVPSRPDSPTDPVDATLQLVVRGEAEADALMAALRGATLAVAIDENGEAVVAPAPDDVPSVLAITAPAHSDRLDVPSFRNVTAEELAEALPAEGVDVLLNPGAPNSMRILAPVFKEAVTPAD